MAIVVGGVLEKDSKYLLVQEAKEKFYAEWFPYEELSSAKVQLRSENFILGAINNARNKLVAPISIVEILN